MDEPRLQRVGPAAEVAHPPHERADHAVYPALVGGPRGARHGEASAGNAEDEGVYAPVEEVEGAGERERRAGDEAVEAAAHAETRARGRRSGGPDRPFR